jgi:hypothetical protein
MASVSIDPALIVRHELDASASGWAGCLLVECKSRGDGLGKADVSVFVDGGAGRSILWNN